MISLRPLLTALLLLAGPAALAQTDLILDGSFERGTTNPAWEITTSTTFSPLCTQADCVLPARTGDWYAFLAGLGESNDMSVAQTVTIPTDATSALLTYHLQLGADDDGTGEFALFIDSIQIETFTQDDLPSFPDYVQRDIDLSIFADGQPHTIRFVAVEVAGTTTDAVFGALVDDVSLVVTTPPGGDAPVNDFAFAAYPIAASDTNTVGTLVGADIEDTFNPSASCLALGPDGDGDNAVWWSFVATGAGTMEAYARGSGADPADTILTILAFDDEGTLTEVACNDDRGTDPDEGSYVTFDTMPGARYFLRVTGYTGEEGEIAVGIGGVSALLSTFVAQAPNDNVAGAPGPLSFSNAPALYPDTNVGATEEPFEPLAACGVPEAADGRNSVWRVFNAPGDGSVTIDWAGSSFDTIGTVHLITLTGDVGEQVACNDDGPIDTRSVVTFPVMEGRAYVVRTVGFEGAEGSILQAFSFDPATDAETVAEASELRLAARPNPAAGPVRLAATVPEAAEARVEVFDALGRRVTVVHDGPVAAGETTWTWAADGQPAGVYIVRLTADGAVRTQTVTVVR